MDENKINENITKPRITVFDVGNHIRSWILNDNYKLMNMLHIMISTSDAVVENEKMEQ